MKLLVTAATILEIKPFITFLDHQSQRISDTQYRLANCYIDVLIAGIGMMHTAFSLGTHLAVRKPDMALQAGIAGSFRREWQLGSLVMVDREYLADLGAEDNDQFKDLFDINLWQPSQPPFTGTALVNTFAGLPCLPELPRATSVSVNLVSGSAQTITRLETRYMPDVESMEGAAFHYACLTSGIPFLQLRSISNYVEIRDKSKWKIPLAIKTLNDELISIVQTIAGLS
ncbi:futalosine hydrolase [Chitinophaga solisilvae]|uniref:Futalosine hydrolase n=1 Tax=Chitinophaga solisilvae TaxID=1233460 RepID=A0A3S1CZB4_9BACT|nr:futalosine hydrolase [Chitinophaga solisilvae]NSL88509.1 futalosine hydrolase [Chitinophaga solisilvae]